MKKILVIEDNPQVQENLQEILELYNYKVLTADNGKIGVEKALEELPDLIICDVMMPVLDGFGVLRILEKKPSTADIPFIFLTAKAENADFRKGMNLGADDYVTKPFDHTELLDVIDIRLKKSERIKKAFNGTKEGLTSFINEAKGQKDLEKLSEERETKKFKKKEVIFQEGALPRRLFFVANGKVKTFKTNEFGKEYVTQLYKTGDFLGYHELLTDSKYNNSAVALEECEISFIPKEDFTALLYNNKDFSVRFIKMLASNVEENEERLLSLAYNSIRKRVAEALVKLFHQYKKDDVAKISILREDLAGIVGTAKESVIRTLTDFKHDNLIRVENNLIIIDDVKKLEDLPY